MPVENWDKHPARIIRDLTKALRANGANVPMDVQVAATRAVRFLRNRLTQAAIHGCHHCDEGERGKPCWWCGLKNTKRVG